MVVGQQKTREDKKQLQTKEWRMSVALPANDTKMYLISHYGAGIPLNRYGSGAFANNQRISLYDDATADQQFKFTMLNNKKRIAMYGSTTLGINVLKTDNRCTLYTMSGNDDDSAVTVVAASEGVECYCIYLTKYGKAIYTLTAATDLSKNSDKYVSWAPYHGGPEQIWKIATSCIKNAGGSHGRTLPARANSTVSPYQWPCVKKTGVRGFDAGIRHYGIDREAYFKQKDTKSAPGDGIYPFYGGTVTHVYNNHADFGNAVFVASSNPTTSVFPGAYMRHLYMHLNGKPKVAVGQAVSKGTLLGYMGTTGDSTGVHLHFGLQARSTAYTKNVGYLNSGWVNPAVALK